MAIKANMSMKIATLEDDPDQAQLILRTLIDAGYDARPYTQGRDLIAALQDETFDLILLDWQLPDIDGDTLLHWVRSNLGAGVPVIFLTSRSREADIVQGLKAGADDYIVKPWRAGELLARITALLRRSQGVYGDEAVFQVQHYRIDPVFRQISLHGECVSSLAPKEFELALLFFRNVGRLFSRDTLAEMVWNRDIPATSRTLDTHLSNIRQKLRIRPENGVRLTSSYALGYRLETLGPGDARP